MRKLQSERFVEAIRQNHVEVLFQENFKVVSSHIENVSFVKENQQSRFEVPLQRNFKVGVSLRQSDEILLKLPGE